MPVQDRSVDEQVSRHCEEDVLAYLQKVLRKLPEPEEQQPAEGQTLQNPRPEQGLPAQPEEVLRNGRVIN